MKLTKRIIFYILGQFILALGVSLSIKTDLGVSPVSSVPLVLGKICGIETGNMTIIVFCIYVLLQYLILRKDFKIYSLLQVPCAVLFGKFVTLTSVFLKNVNFTSYPVRFFFVVISVILIAVGIKLYLWADIVPQAADGLVQTISRKYGWKLANVKNCFDLSSVTVSVASSFLFLKTLFGIREGTLITALLVGRVMSVIEKHFGMQAKAYLQS